MKQQFVNIEYILLAPDVLVPIAWPICGLESFVLEAVRKIIEMSQQESRVIQVNKISARLVRNHSLGFLFVCQLVPKGGVTGGDIYEIFSHFDENNNVIEIGSGSGSGSLQKASSALIKEPLCTLRPRHITFITSLTYFELMMRRNSFLGFT